MPAADARARRVSLGPLLERALESAALAATLAALLLVARNRLLPEQQPVSFALVLWGWLLAFYLGLALLVALGLSLLGRLAGLARLAVAVLRVGPLAFGAVLLVSNPTLWHGLLSLEGPGRHRWLVPLAAVVAVMGLVASALLPLARAGVVRWLAAGAAAAAIAAFWPLSEPALGAGRPSRVHLSGQPLLVVGADGADWSHIEALVARGELPHLAALRRRSAWGPLATIRPTLSPAIWTSVVTGRTPEDHGIGGFTRARLAGVDDTLPRLAPVEGAGVRSLLALLRAQGVMFDSPLVSSMRRVPAFWTIATLYGSPVSTLNWWGTWPAEPVLGYVVSERTYHAREDEAVTYPAELAAEIAPLFWDRSDVTIEEARQFLDLSAEDFRAMRERERVVAVRNIENELPAVIGLFETTRRVALHLIAKGRSRFGRPADLLVLFRIVDQTCHTSLRHSELVADQLGPPEDKLRRYGGVVSAAYRALDRALGELIEAFGPGHVVVLSDHGFRLEGDAERRTYNHRSAPDGVFLAAGPAIRPGPIAGLSVYDVLPLLLYLKELPVARRLEGRLDERLISAEHLAAQPVKRVARYESAGVRLRARGAPEADAEVLERLRALGYLE